MTDEVEKCEDCGKELDSFACRIRHIQINSGVAKAARDGNQPDFGLKYRDTDRPV